MSGSLDDEDRVRRRAYELWEEAGRPDDRGEEMWHRASAEVAAEVPDQSAATSTTAAATVPAETPELLSNKTPG